MTAQRRSRNMATLGMFGVMTLTAALCIAFYAEHTISLPALRMRKADIMQTEIRFASAQNAKQPEMERILAEKSPFKIPENPVPEVAPKSEKAVFLDPKQGAGIKLESQKKLKSELKPKSTFKPKPVSAVQKAAPETERLQEHAAGAGAVSAERSTSESAAVPMPSVAGNTQRENNSSSEILAIIVQAVEKHKRYPRQGRRSGAEGTCTLMVQIGTDGRIASCALAEPSGHSVLDAASKRLGKNLVGLHVGSSRSFKVLVPVHYRLTDH